MAIGRASVKQSPLSCRKKRNNEEETISRGGNTARTPLVPSQHLTFLQFVHRFPPALDATDTSTSSSSTLYSLSSTATEVDDALRPCLIMDPERLSKKKPTKRVSFCTHTKSDKVWSIVHSISNYRKSTNNTMEIDPDRLWWSDEDLMNAADNTASSSSNEDVQEDVASFLIHVAYTQSQKTLDDCRRVMGHYMEEHAIYRPADYPLLEAQLPLEFRTFTNPTVKRRVKKHMRAVLAAQVAVQEEGLCRWGSPRAWDFIALRSKKFSGSLAKKEVRQDSRGAMTLIDDPTVP